MKTLRPLALLAVMLSLGIRHSAPAAPPQQLTSPDQVPEGLAKSDWSSIRAAYEAGRHAFQPVEGGWQARNPGQRMVTRFHGRGFVTTPSPISNPQSQISNPTWQWGLELQSYGFAGRERAIGGVPTVQASGQRLTYGWDAEVQEWFVNDTSGLEHGFTVQHRPDGPADAELIFQLAVRGGLRPIVEPDGRDVRFVDAQGAVLIHYTGLKVWDADGKILPAHFTAQAQSLRLAVDERGARYPLTIDPKVARSILKSFFTTAGDSFGGAVTVAGDTVVVGASLEDSSTTGVNSTPNESATDSGAVYVFVRSGTEWTQQAYLKASNTGADDRFGSAVAVAGDTLVVGVHQEDSSGTGVITTPNEGASNSGAAYVFVRSGTTWTQQAMLKGLNTGSFDQFGGIVSIDGNTLVVGAVGEDGSGTGVNPSSNEAVTSAGAAYVFVRSGTTWTQQAYLKASNTGMTDRFGIAVAVSGDTIAVAARDEDGSGTGINPASNDLAVDSGAAYVFVRSGTTWTPQATLKASNTSAGDSFGQSLALSGDTLVVGATLEDGSGTGVNPASNEAAVDAGAAYVFVRNGSAWTQQALLKASNTGGNDQFGRSVAVSGDTVIVGANLEDGGGTGVNPASDEAAADAGAAYVFVRSGTAWSQQAYLKASNTGAGDRFGSSVAADGGTLFIGATGEDGSGSGVGPASNEDATDAGAAYAFDGFGPPDIAVEQPVGTVIADGGSKDFGTVVLGGNASLTFTIKNTGTGDLTLSGTPAVEVSGTHAGMFTVTAQPTSPVAGPTGTTTFTVQFLPTSTGVKTAALSIANDDGDEGPYDITLTGTGQSVYEAWAIANGVSTDPGALAGENLKAFAFGYAPGGGGALVYTGTFAGGGAITTTGQPITAFETITNSVDFRALFVRRKDYMAAGLTYTPQFSATMSVWANSATVPTVLADDGTNQIVSVPYPFFVAGKKARFFRISLTIAP